METDECLQLTDGFGLASNGEHGLEACVQGLQPQPLQTSDLRVYERLRREVGEGWAAPEGKCPGQARLGLRERLRAKRGLPFAEEPLELFNVDGSGRDAEDVAGCSVASPPSSPRSFRSFET